MFSISEKTIDSTLLAVDLARPDCGAFVAFEGRVRDHNEGKPVTSLEYSAYINLANKEGARILSEAMERFEVRQASCVHRVGHLAVGDCAVWVGVVAPHRKAAYEANAFIIDEVKKRVPIWKCEHYEDGAREWVACHHGCAGK